jgi:hypothetical protein
MLLTSDLHQSGIRCNEQAYNTGTGSVSLRLYVTCTNDDHIALGEDQGKPSSLLQVARVQSIEIMCIFMCECLPQLRLGLSFIRHPALTHLIVGGVRTAFKQLAV